MSEELSKAAYNTLEEAAMGGFSWVLKHASSDWQQREYGFWVVLKAEKRATYHYTIPERGKDTYVTIRIPDGLNIRAFSHTHPKSVSNGDFSSEDLDHFKQVKNRIDFIAFYLMNPFQELRYAKEAKDFLRGKGLAWVKGITE
jgi:hypothetical protein